ncbi:hypothetical protein X975_21768, partial [Stegodyphus mimosarum]
QILQHNVLHHFPRAAEISWKKCILFLVPLNSTSC